MEYPDFSATVQTVRNSVVAVHGRQRMPSSGFCWQASVVVTAEHTLKRDDDLELTLPGLARAPATLVGRDPGTDLAVLRTEAPLTPLARAQGSPQVGQWVLAVSLSPDDGIAASLGIVSGVGGPWRTWRGGQVDAFLRPDLTLYPGFSGGPLVSPAGHVIGLNTSALSRSMNLTIPVQTIERVVNDILTKGRVSRGYLGVGMQPIHLPPRVQEKLGLTHGGGVIVVTVEDDSPADRSGVVVGDILTVLAGQPVHETEDVLALLGPDAIGQSLPAVLVRGGVRHELDLQVGERPNRRGC
ncbi:MAG TPA: trypsin-like peptidase domain-containing protein [Candidatus Xenobia bacterium]|jgi:S1-C subfamily serine protease